MIDWDKITDEETRQDILRLLAERRDDAIRKAGRSEREAADLVRFLVKDRETFATSARYSRRQAAHYQQAIDLLTAAPMPPEPDPQP